MEYCMTEGKDRKLIIIPDVHGRDFWRKAVEDNPGAEFIFLGDYLDPYGFEEITEEEAFHDWRTSSGSKRRTRTG